LSKLQLLDRGVSIRCVFLLDRLGHMSPVYLTVEAIFPADSTTQERND
jgi:hypothetical protein